MSSTLAAQQKGKVIIEDVVESLWSLFLATPKPKGSVSQKVPSLEKKKKKK